MCGLELLPVLIVGCIRLGVSVVLGSFEWGVMQLWDAGCGVVLWFRLEWVPL